MPKFLDLSCYIELTGSNKRLKEYDHDFGDPPRDRYIEMVVPVPDTASTFSIHLQSHKYISPGLSMFVWIDGQYQCNRYKLNLPLPVGNTVSRKSLVDFRVRQKEIRHKDAFIGRDWSFSKLNIGLFSLYRVSRN